MSRRPYWKTKIETMLNTQEMRDQQLQKLIEKTQWVHDNTDFWGGRIKKFNTSPVAIKTWDDFQKRVPITSKEDLRDYSESVGFDMNRIIEGWSGDRAKRLLMIAATSGTTGDPVPYPLAKEDLALWHEFIARFCWRSGLYPGDRALQAFGLSMFLAGVPMLTGLADYGVCGVPVGAEAGTERILKYTKLFKPKALFLTPSLAIHMIERAPEVLGEEIRALGIKILICGGEPGAGIPEVRHKIENAYGARLYDAGAGLGCSCDHPEYQGMHWICDDLAVLELVNQDTHEPVPMEDGAVGLAVFSTLGKSMLLGFRQTFGDVIQVQTSPCPCGRTGLRYKIVGRTDDMLKVKGVMVYPVAIEGVINSFVPRVTGEFRIVLDEPPPRVVPPMKIKLEYGENASMAELKSLAEAIAEQMQRRVKIRPDIEWVPPRTLERFVKKKKYFEKTYE